MNPASSDVAGGIRRGPREPEWEVARLFPPRGEWTEETYLSLPDTRRVELSGGCLEFLPMPTEDHQLIAAFLYEALAQFVRSRRLGTVLFMGIPVRTATGEFREPDVVFMMRENAHRRLGKYWDGADLVMEVVSPARRDRDLVRKRAEYARAGIPEYWIVDPEQERVTVLVLQDAEYRTVGEHGRGAEAQSVLLSDFALSVDAIFDSAAPEE